MLNLGKGRRSTPEGHHGLSFLAGIIEQYSHFSCKIRTGGANLLKKKWLRIADYLFNCIRIWST